MSDQTDDFLERATRELLPIAKSSALSIIVCLEPDAKFCLEVGAAILFDKPIIAVVPTDRTVPAHLKRIASAIIQGDIHDPATKDLLQQAISNVIDNDTRTH